MDRRLFLGGALTCALGSGFSVSDCAAAPSKYKLPFGRIPAVGSDSLSADGRYVSIPLKFRPDNEIALISFEQKVEHRLVFSDWVQATDTALNHDGSRLAVVCWNSYVESSILIIDTANFAIIETVTTPLDIYLRPVYWNGALFYARTTPIDPEHLVMRYPGLGGPDLYRVWQHIDGVSKVFLDAHLPKPLAIDLIDGNTFIYRCDFREAFHKPNLAQYKTSDSRPIYVMDGLAPMSIMAVSKDRVYMVDSERIYRLDANLDAVLALFGSMSDAGTSSINLRNIRQFEVRLSTNASVVPIRSGYDYNNVQRYNGTDFLVRTPDNSGSSEIMVVTSDGGILQNKQINTSSDADVSYHKFGIV